MSSNPNDAGMDPAYQVDEPAEPEVTHLVFYLDGSIFTAVEWEEDDNGDWNVHGWFGQPGTAHVEPEPHILFRPALRAVRIITEDA